MRLLLDEMYSTPLARALAGVGVDAVSVADLRLTGAPDTEVFETARGFGLAVLTENVGDFVRLAADHVISGGHHPGLVIALSSRFSRRPAGVDRLTAAILAVADEPLDDRVDSLKPSAG